MSDHTSIQSKLSEFANIYNPIVQTVLLAVIGFTLVVINSASNRTTRQQMWEDTVAAGHAVVVTTEEGDTAYRYLPPVHEYEREIEKFKELAALQTTYVVRLEEKVGKLEQQQENLERVISQLRGTGVPDTGLDLVVDTVPMEIVETEEPEVLEGPKKKRWYQFWKKNKDKEEEK
jgi:hypothetical protein